MNGLSLLLYSLLFAQTNGLNSSTGFSAASGNGPSTSVIGNSNNNPNLSSNLSSGNPASFGNPSSFQGGSSSDERSFGWQIKDNELEYLVQISPSSLSFMQDTRNRQEAISNIPPELSGRIKRIIVSIGDEVLPRSPSLADIAKMIPTVAKLPPGRMQDMESASVVNVNNAGGNGFNGFPQSGASSFGSSNGYNAQNSTANAYNQPNSSGLGSSGYTGTQGQGSLLDRFNSSGTGISGSSRFNNTQPLNSQNPGYDRLAQNSDLANRRTDPYSLGTNGSGASGNGGWGATNTLAGSTLGAGYNSNLTGQYNQGSQYAQSNQFGQGGQYAQGGLNSQNQYTQGQYQPNSLGQANQYGQGSSSVLGNSYARNNTQNYSDRFNTGQGGYADDYNNPNSQYQYQRQQAAQNGSGFGNTYDQFGNSLLDARRAGASLATATMGPLSPIASGGYLASNNAAALPSTSYIPTASDRNYLDSQRGYPSNRDLQSGSVLPYRATNENNLFFYVFFILSIAVNIWMVHLLRSLYLRYRNLLGSLRSQATS